MALCLLLAASCSKNKKAKRAPAPPQPVSASPRLPAKPVHIGEVERGIASWYGEPYHGRRAANGEIFDMNQLTAAHKTMPFNTWVRVENETNGKTVDVRITDRGPFVAGRIIDLSRKAAERISMIGPGTAKVKLTVITPKVGSANPQ